MGTRNARPRSPATDQAARGLVLGCALVLVLFVLGLVVLWLLSLLVGALGIPMAITRFRPQLLAAAAVAFALWLSVLGAIRFARRPRTPSEGPATSELGPESPALANMLAEGFATTREAVSATLLDLAARGYVDIEGTKPSSTVCRIRRRDDEGLSEYERMVLDLLRRRAVDGVVPAGALTTGTETDDRAWWRAFRSHVEAEARDRGLSRDLWDTRTLWWLAALGLIPGPLVGLAYFNYAPAMVAITPVIVVLSVARARRRQRDTPQGLRAASLWLGVRRHLQDDPAFPDLPPGAVTVWERYLAYGAALGAARGTVRALPLGAEDDHVAWSTHGERWREVRVRYPSIWPPAWGWRPGTALLVGLLVATVALLMLRGALAIGWPEADPSVPDGLVTFARVLAVGFTAGGALALVWSVPAVARAVASFRAPRDVSGHLVRVRTFGKSSKSPGVHYVAVDDGSSDRIRAYRVPETLWGTSRIRQYRDATVSVLEPIGRVTAVRQAPG